MYKYAKVTRIGIETFLKMLDSNIKPFQRVLCLTRQREMRVRQMERETGKKFAELVNDMIDNHFRYDN